MKLEISFNIEDSQPIAHFQPDESLKWFLSKYRDNLAIIENKELTGLSKDELCCLSVIDSIALITELFEDYNQGRDFKSRLLQ